MKLFIISILFIFVAVKGEAFLIPSPKVSFDTQLEGEVLANPEKKKELFTKYADDYYNKYIEELKKLNPESQNPFDANLKNDILRYINSLSADELNSISNEVLQVFLREQMADQLYLPMSKNTANSLTQDAARNLKIAEEKVAKLEEQLIQIQSSREKTKSPLIWGFSLDSFYWGIVGLLALIILGILLKPQGKK